LEELDKPEAKASLIWIVGEYANKIENADELLSVFIDTFTEKSYLVRILPISRCFPQPTPYIIGATADAHSSRETVPLQGLIPGFGPACSYSNTATKD
jgi:hypothetical protein